MEVLFSAILFLIVIKIGIYLVFILDISEEKDNGKKDKR